MLGPPRLQGRAAAHVQREQMNGRLVPPARTCLKVLGGEGKGPEGRGVADSLPASSRLAGRVPRGPGWRPVFPWSSLGLPPILELWSRDRSAGKRTVCSLKKLQGLQEMERVPVVRLDQRRWVSETMRGAHQRVCVWRVVRGF